MRNNAEAEDLVHLLFVDVVRGTVKNTDLPYLFRATTHRCLNHLRDHQRRGVLLDQLPAPASANSDSSDERDLLVKTISQLPPKIAEVAVLHYFDELSQDEVADLVGLSRRTVGKYLGYAREALVRLSQEAQR